ncbi:MAG: hypothetical protein LBI31_01900, partial [Zoogloeaceae bacterium]|nr:hypothetical protein [Zoogloeaceae bacterium]
MKTKLPILNFLVLAFAFLAGSTACVAQTVTVSTFAGGGENGDADGKGTDAQFELPFGIAADMEGNLYVADTGNHSIRKITPEGEVSTIAGTRSGFPGSADGTGNAARFKEPYGVTIDAAGNLYVADSGNHSIRKITPKGEVSTLAGSGEEGFADGEDIDARFAYPAGIAIDAAGNLYVADSQNHRIRKVTPKGVVSTIAGSGKEGFANGKGVAAQFHRPSGIAIDAAGNLYVADTGNNRIRKVTPKGMVSTFAGSGKTGDADGLGSAAQFFTPASITVDKAGNLYVVDSIGNRVRKITPEGKVSTLAGSGEQGFADGKGSAARFLDPYGIAIDAAGNLYVADTF